MSPAAQLEQGLLTLGIDLQPSAQEKLLDYAALLYKWNKTYSLTAMREQDKAVSHHLLDSLAIVPFIPTGTLLDVGSGGGMPGIPLAIAYPDLQVYLLDSNSKKAAFLQQAVIELGLRNIYVHCGRVEQYHPEFGFSAITSRAFSSLAEFTGLSRHLLADDGLWLAMKGAWPYDEIDKLPVDVQLSTVHPLHVPGVEGARHLVVMRRSGAECSGGI